jgi:uncharacterized protein (TIGR03083 family)
MDDLEVIRREGDVFYTTAATADPELGVPSCPGWLIADLVWHLGEVQWFWGSIIEQRIPSVDSLDSLERPTRPDHYPDLVEWGRSMLERLLQILETTDDATTVWTWAPQQNVGFIRRHQVQETAVHRWDMQDAATSDPPTPIDPEAASDSIDEFLTYSLPMGLSKVERLEGSVHLHCTDTEGEWFVHQDKRVERLHEKAAVAMRGTASDLLLTLYARVDLDQIEVIGDESIARHLIEHIDLE